MTKKIRKLSLLMTILLFSSTQLYSITAYQVIKKMDEQQRGKTSFSRVSVTIIRPRFKRNIVLDSWDDRIKDKFFLRILKPNKDRGVTFLKSGKSLLWQYIPKIGKEIKIESSLMGDSWMGSDFTNDDLMKQSSIVNDYNHQMLAPQKRGTYKIELKPKPSVASVWSKIIMHIKKSNGLAMQEEFYDHKGRLKKLMKLSHFKKKGGRLMATKMVMATIKNNRVRSKTVMIYQKVVFNRAISNYIFSKANLRR